MPSQERGSEKVVEFSDQATLRLHIAACEEIGYLVRLLCRHQREATGISALPAFLEAKGPKGLHELRNYAHESPNTSRRSIFAMPPENIFILPG